jgi:hypothetical protein
LHKIFNGDTLKRVVISDPELSVGLIVLILLQGIAFVRSSCFHSYIHCNQTSICSNSPWPAAIIDVAWLAIDPLHLDLLPLNSLPSNIRSAYKCTGAQVDLFTGISYAYKVVIILVTCFLSFKVCRIGFLISHCSSSSVIIASHY